MWTPLELAILMYPHYSIVQLPRSRDVCTPTFSILEEIDNTTDEMLSVLLECFTLGDKIIMFFNTTSCLH